MVDLSVIQWLDLAGVFVFASSGALVAVHFQTGANRKWP